MGEPVFKNSQEIKKPLQMLLRLQGDRRKEYEQMRLDHLH
jgi:hypothetical protein